MPMLAGAALVLIVVLDTIVCVTGEKLLTRCADMFFVQSIALIVIPVSK